MAVLAYHGAYTTFVGTPGSTFDKRGYNHDIAALETELARFDTGQRFTDGKNYLFASPWAPTHVQMRRIRPRTPDCGFCGNSTTRLAWQAVWPEIMPAA